MKKRILEWLVGSSFTVVRTSTWSPFLKVPNWSILLSLIVLAVLIIAAF